MPGTTTSSVSSSRTRRPEPRRVPGRCRPQTGLDEARQLGIEARFHSFIKLSNGQCGERESQMSATGCRNCSSDDPFLEWTPRGVEIAALLGGLVRQGCALVLICSPDAVPNGLRPMAPPSREASATEPNVRDRRLRFRLVGRTIVNFAMSLSRTAVAPFFARVSPTVREGERWAVQNFNGSGRPRPQPVLWRPAGLRQRHTPFQIPPPRVRRNHLGRGSTASDCSPRFHLYFSEPLAADPSPPPDSSTASRIAHHARAELRREATLRRVQHASGGPVVLQLSTGEQRLAPRALLSSGGTAHSRRTFQLTARCGTRGTG